MKRRQWIWLVWSLVLLSYLIPYTVLSGVRAWYGSFLFWIIVGLLVVVLNVIITKDLVRRDDE